MDRCIMQFAWVSSSEISKWALLLTEQTTHTYLTSPCLPAPPDLCPSAERESEGQDASPFDLYHPLCHVYVMSLIQN